MAVFAGLLLGAADILPHHEFTFMIGLWLALVVGAHNFMLLPFHVETEDVARRSPNRRPEGDG
jgi:hypothetical protein